jgi:hypothetical protein
MVFVRKTERAPESIHALGLAERFRKLLWRYAASQRLNLISRAYIAARRATLSR